MIKSRDLCLLLFLSTAVRAVAAADGGLSADISRCEQVYFGHTSVGQPAQKRVAELERVVLGKPSTGPLIPRLKKVDQALGIVAPSSAKQHTQQSAINPVTADGAWRFPALHDHTAKPLSGTAKAETLTAHDHPTKPSSASAKAEMLATGGLQSETAKEDTPPVAPTTVPNTKQLLQLGTERFKEGDVFGADAAFRQVLSHDPNNVDALYNLGAISEGRSDYVSALGLYKSALQQRPHDQDLKQAVASVEAALSKQTPLDARPFRSASMDTTNTNFVSQSFNGSKPLVGNVLTHGDPALLNVSSPRFPVVNNTIQPMPTAPVVSKSKAC